MEPRYVIQTSKPRVLIPEALKLFGLCLLLYVGIILNAYLLSWTIPIIIHGLISSILLVLIVMELILKYIHAKKSFSEVYLDRIIVKTHKGETVVMLVNCQPTIENGVVDKAFKTSDINLGETKIRHVKKPEEIVSFLEQSKKYAEYYASYAASRGTEGTVTQTQTQTTQ